MLSVAVLLPSAERARLTRSQAASLSARRPRCVDECSARPGVAPDSRSNATMATAEAVGFSRSLPGQRARFSADRDARRS